MAEIRRFYEELNKFWKDEICHVAEALKKGRIEPGDLERWKNFHSSLKQTIKFWKVCVFSSTMHFQIEQNIVFRIGHQTAMPKPYTATIHPLLLFVHPPFCFGSSLY